MLWIRGKTENLNAIKTLIALHPEEVHVIALAQSKKKQGGVFGMGATSIEFHDFASLSKQRVAAAGGSHVTAQALKLLSDVDFEIIEAPSNETAIQLLRTGDVEAVVAVGGSPLPWIEQLDRTFKLLPFGEIQKEKLKTLYSSATLNYSNLAAMGIPTVATDALFVTREYKTARMQSGLGQLRQCVYKSIDDLRETIGYHPKWQVVDPTYKGKLPWYDLPNSSN